jgi:VWFA-related protein
MAKALAALSLVLGIVAQPFDSRSLAQDRQPTFRSRADLVEVDVVVVDKDGTPIRGLKTADFVLRDRGKAQTIASFDEMSHERADGPSVPALPAGVKRDVSNNQDAQSGRLIVMVLDDLHIYKQRTDRAKEIARKVLAELGPRSSMAVLFTSQEHSTLVSEDPAVLRAAIDTLKGRQSWRRPHQARDTQKAAGLSPDMDALSMLDRVSQSQETNLQDFFENLTQYKTLQDAARLLGGGDARRKAFVLVSEGIGKDLSGIFGAMSPQGQIPEVSADQPMDATGHYTVQPKGYHEVALVNMMEAMRRSNVATYAIDPRGLVKSSDLLLECSPAPVGPMAQVPQRGGFTGSPFNGADSCSSGLSDFDSIVRQAQRGLEITSEASGGFAVTNTDDFTGGLEKIVDDLDHYYLLGFYPVDPKGSGYRKLDVQVPGHPDWRLRFRHGYMPGGQPPPPKNGTPMLALSAGVLPKGDLPLRLTVIPLATATAGMTRLALALEVTAPVAALRDADGRLRDTLKYDVLVVDEKKARVRSLGGLEGKLQLSPAGRPQDLPESVTYQVEQSIEIAAGRYEVRVSAASDRLAKGGSVYLDVVVPDLRSGPVAIGGVAIAYADGARVPVAPPTVRRAPLLPFAPTLDRAFTPADSLRVFFEGVSRSRQAKASIDVIDASGRSVLSVIPTVTPGDPLRVEDVVSLRNLAPGPYTLRAMLTDGTRTATRDLGFAVR